jgi:hypothetical protein
MSDKDQRTVTAVVSRRLALVMLAGIISIMAFGPVAAQPVAPSAPAAPAATSVPVASTPHPTPIPAAPIALPSAAAPITLPVVTLPAPEFSTVDLAPPSRPVNYQHIAPQPEPDPVVKAAPKPRAEAKPKPEAKSTPKSTAKPKQTTSEPKSSPTSYSGVSKLWYPALGINAKWSWWGCDYGGGPEGLGAGVYRWGCGPKNNVYLMSHAWSTFKAIQRGYHSGKMKVGQSVWYADKKGKVSQWKVKWIKRVKIDYFNATYSEWATNDSPTPIMTFQTCDGSKSQYRIIVRLVPSG